MAGVNIVIDTMDPATENEMSLDGIKLLLNNQWDEAHKLFAKHRLVVRNCVILSPMMEISGAHRGHKGIIMRVFCKKTTNHAEF